MASLEDRLKAGYPSLSRLGRTDENGIPRRNAMMQEVAPDLARFIGEACWGSLWSRPALTTEQRSLATMSIISCLRRDDNLDGHIEAGLDLGFSPETIIEIPIHLIFYAGAPIATTTLRVCYNVFQRRGLKIEPYRLHDPSMDTEELYQRGLAKQREVMGDHIPGGLGESDDPVDQDWNRYLTEYLWGAVWTRPGLDVPSRLICTLAAMTEIGTELSLSNYIRAALRAGITQEQVKELFYHLTFYSGAPRSLNPAMIANQVFSEL
jgi:alkylhydroperoxidase/carboxymuconolactone decarboxylase family protein YurZ